MDEASDDSVTDSEQPPDEDTGVHELRRRVSRDPIGSTVDHESRLRHLEKCVTKIDTRLKIAQWLAGVMAVAALTGTIAVVQDTWVNGERLTTATRDISAITRAQERQTESMEQLTKALVKDSSDGENQRTANRAAIERVRQRLENHSTMRRH